MPLTLTSACPLSLGTPAPHRWILSHHREDFSFKWNHANIFARQMVARFMAPELVGEYAPPCVPRLRQLVMHCWIVHRAGQELQQV